MAQTPRPPRRLPGPLVLLGLLVVIVAVVAALAVLPRLIGQPEVMKDEERNPTDGQPDAALWLDLASAE